MLKKIGFKISWQRFYEQCKADIKLWCYFIVLQQACRFYFISALYKYLSHGTAPQTIVYAMLHGLRFDSLWATCWVFMALAFLTIPSLFIDKISYAAKQKFRRYLGGVFTFVTTLIYVTSVEYYREFADGFNYFLFDWLYDDKLAILKTIYTHYHPIRDFIIVVVVLLLYIKLSSRFISNAKPNKSKKYSATKKILLSIAIVCFYVIGFRGSIGHRPIQLKDAGVTTDRLLNKSIVSPYSYLKYASDDYWEQQQESQEDLQLASTEVLATARKFFGTKKYYPVLAKYLKKTAKGPKLAKPKHIFLIIGESLDAWPLQEQYRQLGLATNLQKIIGNGSLYFKYFLPCACGTMETINTIMNGVQDCGLHSNYRKGTKIPTTLAPQFKKLGYKPQFFYGGYLSWQQVGDFAASKDFAAVYGAAHINDSWTQTNEWGVDDRSLFNFIIATVKNSKSPTFNVIMTTSNHPPFSIDLKREGFPKEQVAELLAQHKPSAKGINALGHVWYADKAIGEFVKNVTAMNGNVLVAITGDHYGRRHILSQPPAFEVSAVPLIIYPGKLKKYSSYNVKMPQRVAGSHLDLAPTLIELIAPKGFTYYAIGNDLLVKRRFNFGIGKNRVITPDFIALTEGSEDIAYFNKTESSAWRLKALKERVRQSTDIAKYLIKKGDVNVALAKNKNK